MTDYRVNDTFDEEFHTEAAPTVGPTGTLYVNGSASLVSVTITGSHPNWRASCSLAGRTAGDRCRVQVAATINGVGWTLDVGGSFILQRLDIDANNRVRLASGTGAGEISLSSGEVTVGSVSASAVSAIQSGLSTLTLTQVQNELAARNVTAAYMQEIHDDAASAATNALTAATELNNLAIQVAAIDDLLSSAPRFVRILEYQ